MKVNIALVFRQTDIYSVCHNLPDKVQRVSK